MNFSERYSRQINCKSFGEAAQKKLSAARVLVVGAGGLGTPALQYLTAMGVGHIGIIDGDIISLSNLNRQVLYTEADMGKSKVAVISGKLSEQNPGVKILPYNFHLTPANALNVVKEYDLVIDATDNFEARYLINDACVILAKPFIYGAVQEFEGQLSIFNLGHGPTYRCLYPSPAATNEIPDCNVAGVPGVIPGIIGTLQALEAIKIITGIGKTLSGKVQVFDFLNDEQYKITLKTVAQNKEIKTLADSYNIASSGIHSISPKQLHGWINDGKEIMLWDVREEAEYKSSSLQAAINWPLTYLEKGEVPANIKTGIPVILFCEKGSRSERAYKILFDKNFIPQIYTLTGGLERWKNEFDTFMAHE